MNQRPDFEKSIFRQEALDEFSSRTQGDVLGLPVIKIHWLIFMLGVWAVVLLALLAWLPWREPFLINGQLELREGEGASIITFVMPAHIAVQLQGHAVALIAGGGMVKMTGVQLKTMIPELWWQRLSNGSTQYRSAAWVAQVADSYWSQHYTANTYQLKVVSENLIDVLLLKFAGCSSIAEEDNEATHHIAN